jgi:hypothetical protein
MPISPRNQQVAPANRSQPNSGSRHNSEVTWNLCRSTRGRHDRLHLAQAAGKGSPNYCVSASTPGPEAPVAGVSRTKCLYFDEMRPLCAADDIARVREQLGVAVETHATLMRAPTRDVAATSDPGRFRRSDGREESVPALRGMLARTDAPIGCSAASGPRGKQPRRVLHESVWRNVTIYFLFWKSSLLVRRSYRNSESARR